MAKFKVEDPSGLENLIKVVPQSTTPKYTGAIAKPGQDLNKYDQGITMFDTPESRRELNYQNQTGWQAWGNALGQSLAEVTAGTLEGFGYLLDLEQHVKALAGTEKEFDNEFSKTMRQFKDSVREEMPVFTDPNKPFDPLNSRWWASNLPSIVSTLTLMVPTGAAVGAIGKLGKVGRALTSEAKLLGGLTSGRAITSGAISRVLESTMEAAGNADQVYQQLIAEGKSEEEARTEAGKVASNTYYANLPLMLADTFEYSVLFRNKGIDNAVDALSRQTKKSLLKNSLAVGSSFLSEGFEEGYQYGVGQEAKKSKNAGETIGNVINNFGEYFDDPEFLSSVVVGGMSGAGFQALGNVIESRSAKLANAFPEFDETVLQGLAASTGQSISDLKVAAQAAFKKFKGNMSDALADIDGTIKNLPKEIKESTREAYRLGLQALKEAGKITDETLQQVQSETISDSLWKGTKDKLKQGIDKLKKWAGINEEIQRLEASGNETQSELAKKREFVNLLKEDQAKADEFLIRAKEQNINTQDYEDIFKAYKEGLLQHPDNPDAVEAKVQAKIIRQEKRNLEENIANQGTEYNNFDLNSLREEYLNKDGSSEAKSLKSGIEPIKGHNKNVPQELKDKVKQLVDLEIEEVRLIKEADKLATKAGQEELAAKKKEDKIAEIKQSTNPDVLFDTYEDKDLAETAEQRQSKLLQSELGRLPDPNQFTDYNEFKESLTSSNFPVLGTAKNDPKYDRALIKYYNKHTLSNVKHVFEESDKVLTLEKIEGQKVLFKGKEYIVVKENGKYILVSEYEIIELDQNASVRELGIALPYELPKKTYNVVIESENEVTVNNTKYLINLDSKGNVESLTPLNKPDQRIHNEQMLIAVEIERNKQEFKEISTDNYEEIVDTFDLKAIEEIYANGYTEEIDNALDKLYNGEKLNSREKSVVSKWLNNVEDLLYKLLEYADNENVENAIKNVEIINLLLTEQNDKFYEKPEETGSDDADTKAKEKAEKSLDSLPRRRVYKQDVQQSLTYKLGSMREMQTPIIEEEEEFEKSSTEEIPELESELDKLQAKRKAETKPIEDEIEKLEKELEDSDLKGAYDFSASSNSGKWNSANNELISLVQDNRKAFSIYKFMIGEALTFKEIVDFLNERGIEIPYTERMKRADETMSSDEIKDAIDSYNNSSELSLQNKAQIQSDVLSENNLKADTEYTPSELLQKFPISGVQKVIWNLIKNIVDKLQIKVKFSTDNISEGFDGSFNPLTGEILIRPSTLTNERFTEVLVHEVVHALTTKIIQKVNQGLEIGLTTRQINAVKGLMRLYNAIKADNNLQNKYPLKDVFEFIAHLTNEEFVKELESKDKNFIQKVVDFILDILGISNANELAKKYLVDIISDGTFLQEQGIVILKSDYAGGVQESRSTEILERINELKQQLKEINDKYDKLESELRYKYNPQEELESELDNYPELNEELQDNLDLTGDFMLHSQLWSMRRGTSWEERQFNKVTQKEIDEGLYSQDQLNDNKQNSEDFIDWTNDKDATEDLFNNFGDPNEYEVYFEVTKKEWKDRNTGKPTTTTIDNHWIRVYVIKNRNKIYIGQLQSTSKTKDNPRTNTPALQALREKADEELKGLKVGESKVLGKSRIVRYSPGLYNNLGKPRDVAEALTDEERENLSIGVYMGQHDELGNMITNNPSVKPVIGTNAKHGSVYVAKKTPTGEWRWFACITKSLREMPKLIQELKDILAIFESTNPADQERIKSSDFIATTLAKLRTIVRYKVGEKFEPNFNSDIVNVAAYQVNGVFNINKFIEANGLLDRKVQIDVRRLTEEGYVESILDRLITDIDRIPFVNPFITVAAPDTKVLSTPKEGEETTTQQEPVKAKTSTKRKSFNLRVGQKPQLYKGQINIEQALKELKRILPSGYTINILKELIQSGGVSAYGMVHEAALTLSEKAPFGTEYHEAWHAIEQVLPKFQFDRLQKHLTEEDRADLFAEYMMTNQAPSFLKRIFQLVKAFLQDLINYHPSLLDLFERANAGYYTNKKIQRYGTFYKIDGLTERNKQDFVNVYLATVGEFFDLSKKETVKNLINPDPTKNNLTLAKSIVEVDEEGVESVDNSPLVEFFTNVLKVKGREEANKLLAYIRPDLTINENEEFVSNGKPEMGILYPEILKALGKRGYKIVLGKTELDTTLKGERELEDGEEFEDPETDTLEGWQESASLRSPIEKLSKRMKQLIYSVRSDKKDSLGLGMQLTYDGYEAFSRLAAVIVDSIDINDMYAKIGVRKDKFFTELTDYIYNKFSNHQAIWTELYKALGDKTQPEFWVTQEVFDEEKQIPGLPEQVEIRVFQANRTAIKNRVRNILGDYKGTDAKKFLALIDMQDVYVDDDLLSTALKHANEKERMLRVWKLIGDKIYSKFIASHLNVEGKKQYEIINGGFFSKLTQRLQRDFEKLKADLFNKDPFLKQLPILQTKPKAGDFQFVIYAGYKDKNGRGLMYNKYTEKEFVTSTYQMWFKEKIHMMPILSDSPNLIGVRYVIPDTTDREEMIAKIIQLEHRRSKDTHGIKNYNPNVNIFEEIPYKENLSEQILEVIKYFDKAELEFKKYAKDIKAQIQYSSKNNRNLVRTYLLDHAIVHSQMSMISIGHLSFYKNLEDYYKRAKEIWSPVIKGNVDNYFIDKDGNKIEVFSKWQRVNVLPTVESPSSQAAELESIGFTDYKKVDKTDAQTYIDLISYRDRMLTLNEWTDKHQDAFVQLAKGEIPTEDIVGLFNVLKPFYFNQHVVDGNLVSPVQKKDSELLILPIYGLETINGEPNIMYNPLWKEHLESMGYNFDTMSYDEQGRKEGKYFDITTYDTTMKVGMRSEMLIDLSKWGKQQETPDHHYMSDAIFGTQIMKLITGNLEGEYMFRGKKISAEQLWREYNALVSGWVEDNYQKVINEYGSEEKLKRMIIEEMINKGMRDDYIRSIQQLPLTHPIHFNKVVQIINSFAKKNITDLTFKKGYTMANASSEGFQRELKIKWNNNDPKQGIDYFEVFAPIHDERIKNYMVGGVVDMDALRKDIELKYIPDLLSGLVYRIPTEGKYSMFKIKIVGFLPVDNGVLFMPDMVTKIAGLDFDIDKVRGFFLGSQTDIISEPGEEVRYAQIGDSRQDTILELMMAVLSSPQSLKEQLTPGGFDNLKDNNRYIRGYKAGIAETDKLMKTEAGRKELDKKLQDKMPFFSPMTLSKIAKRMNTGKALIGTAANTNAVHSLMEAYSFFNVSGYEDKLKIRYNGETLLSLSERYDVEGNLISSNIAELLAAFVDNGKDPQAEYSNINSDTIGVALYLLKKGVPLNAVQFFMTQVTEVLPYNSDAKVEFDLSMDDLLASLKDKNVETNYNAVFASLQGKAKKFESYIAGIKVANSGAGATMVDNYLKIERYKKGKAINSSVIDDSGLTKTFIEKGLLDWNDFIVNTFKVPDVNRGTIVNALNLMIDHVLLNVSDQNVKDLYNSFITFVSSGYFTYNDAIVQKLTNPDKIQEYKLMYPSNKFLNRLELKDGYLQFIGANTNDELEIQSIIDNWEELLNSENEATRNFGEALVKYAFYQRGFDFGVGSFGHLIPVSYFIKNTEFTKYYTETMRALDQPNQEKANAFVEQYIANNYKDVNIPIVEGIFENDTLYVIDPPSINEHTARYVKFKGIIFKYIGDGTYKQLPTRAKYVGNNKYLQRYDFDKPAKEFNSEPSRKTFQEPITKIDAVTEQFIERSTTKKNVVVPEGSSNTNLPVFETEDSIFLMNDQQQEAYNKIKQFITDKLKNRSTDQTLIKVSKLGTGLIPKGLYDNSFGLLGRGGVGKTTVIKKIIEDVLKEQDKGYNNVNVRFIAPTHTAATMLQDALGMDSEQVDGVSTFASLVGRNQLPGSLDGIPENSDLLMLTNNKWLDGVEDGKIKPVSETDIYIVDESSMISNTMIQNFMQRFNLEEGSKLPVFIFLGDYRQLPPIKKDGATEKFSEGIISATIFANKDKNVELTQVMRSKDEELHKVFDSVGVQITKQREQILLGNEPDKFDWKKYDDATSKSTENILVVKESGVDQVIKDYVNQLVSQDNPYHIFWTHYNNLDNQRTKILFDKIRKEYFSRMGISNPSSDIMKGDYIQYTQSIPMPTKAGEYNGEKVIKGVVKPQSRYKVKDIVTEDIPVGELSDVLSEYFGDVKIKGNHVYLVNRKDKIRYVPVLEKGAIKEGAYNKQNKTKLVTVKTSTGESITREIPYGKFKDIKPYADSSRKGLNEVFKPSYIGSTHTVQGASIKTIIVGDYNIRQNQGSVDMRDIESSLYTALTRSAGKLVIIKPNGIPIENNQEVFSYTLQTPETVVPSQEIITFTQEMVDTINENVRKAGYKKQYTIEELNAMPEDRKKKAIDCYGSSSKAENGMSIGFKKGGKWELVTEFKGASHDKGGIDISVNNGQVKLSSGNNLFEAKNGLLL